MVEPAQPHPMKAGTNAHDPRSQPLPPEHGAEPARRPGLCGRRRRGDRLRRRRHAGGDRRRPGHPHDRTGDDDDRTGRAAVGPGRRTGRDRRRPAAHPVQRARRLDRGAHRRVRR